MRLVLLIASTCLLSLAFFSSSQGVIITETRQIYDSSTEAQVQVLANSAENVINLKTGTKVWGPTGRKTMFADRNIRTTGPIISRDPKAHENTQIELGGIFKVKKLIFYLTKGQDASLFKDFTIMMSLDCFFCGQRENLMNSFVVARRVHFNSSWQSIEFDFGQEGILTGFISVTNVDQWENSNDPSPPLMFTEIIALGELYRPRFKPANASIQRTSPSLGDYKLSSSLAWSMNYRKKYPIWPESMETIQINPLTKHLLFYGHNQGCAYGCDDKCSTVFGKGVQDSTKNVHWVVSTNSNGFYVKGKLVWSWIQTNLPLLYNSLKFVGLDYTLYKDTLPPSPDSNSIAVIYESSGYYEKEGNAEKIIDFLKNGQHVVILRTTYGAATGQGLEKVLSFLNVKVLNINQGGKGVCKRSDSKVFNMVSAAFLAEIITDVTVHFLDQVKDLYTLPAGSDNAPADVSAKNSLDYIMMWKANEVGCWLRNLSDEIQKFIKIWDSYTQDDFLRRFFPGIGSFPPMTDPDAPKDALIVRVNSVNIGRFASARVGASTDVPFAVRIVEGNPSAFELRPGCNNDVLDKVSPRYYNLRGQGYILGNIGNFKDIRYTFAKPLNVKLLKPEKENHFVTLAFSGVYRTADFVYKDLKNKEEIWNKSLDRTYFGHAELTGDRFSQCSLLRRFRVKPFESLNKAHSVVEKWVKTSNTYQSGRDPWSYYGEYGNYDVDIGGGGGMHSGYPFQAHLGPEIVDGEQLQTSGSWGQCHEMGHNIDNSRVKMNDCGEVTNNVLCWASYIYSKVESPKYVPGTSHFEMDEFIQQWKNKQYWYSTDCKYSFYGYYGWKFGVGVQSNAWRLLVNSDDYLNISKEARYAWAMSKVTGVDLGPYQRFIGMPLTDDELKVTASVAKECWLPYGDQWADLEEIRQLIADFQRELGRNCTAQTTRGESDIPLDRYYDKIDPTIDVDKFENIQNPALTFATN